MKIALICYAIMFSLMILSWCTCGVMWLWIEIDFQLFKRQWIKRNGQAAWDKAIQE